WYIELIKDRLYKKTPEEKQIALQVAVYVLKNFLKLLHPYAPFITEEIYQHIKSPAEPDIIVAPWPKVEFHSKDKTLTERFELLQEIVTALRTARSEMNISPATQIELIVRTSADAPATELLNNAEICAYIQNLVKVTSITVIAETAKPHHSSTVVVRGSEFFIPLEGVIDLAAETTRLEKEINRLTGLLKGVSGKLSNPDFIAKAPREIIAREREKEQLLREQLHKFKANLKVLSD
ncbi:MAG: class I tRNA ligase family protein, partial [Candidatus Neomarinimicrobiota bacterium]